MATGKKDASLASKQLPGQESTGTVRGESSHVVRTASVLTTADSGLVAHPRSNGNMDGRVGARGCKACRARPDVWCRDCSSRSDLRRFGSVISAQSLSFVDA